MSTEDNQATAQRVIEEAWNQGNFSVIAELIGPDMLTATPERHTQSAREMQQTIRLYRVAFPDLHVSITNLLADGEQVAAQFTAQGSHTGVVQGVAGAEVVAGLASEEDHYRKLLLIPPTGRQVTFEGIALFGFSNEKVSSFWALWDEIDLLRQIGALPMVGSALPR
jgi:predicted ester cyclase